MSFRVGLLTVFSQGVFADMTDEQYLTPEVETPGPRARRSGRTARK